MEETLMDCLCVYRKIINSHRQSFMPYRARCFPNANTAASRARWQKAMENALLPEAILFNL